MTFQELYRLATQRDAEAQHMLGFLYHFGVSYNGAKIPQDYKEAIRWYRLAADQGCADSQDQLGEMYISGKGSAQDYLEAARTHTHRGVRHHAGMQAPKKSQETARWYRLAAEQGYAFAQHHLGNMYLQGAGVTKDAQEGLRWIRLAAEQGLSIAQGHLGLMYEAGEGVPQDPVQAHMWLNLVAAQGVTQAIEARDRLARKMSSAQIEDAHRLAREWKPRK
jgi:TPR repeat protein